MIIAVDIVKFLFLIVVTYFLSQIITNQNKRISIIGTFLISFSTAVVEYINSGLLEVLIFGELFLICVNSILEGKIKYLSILGMFLSILGYLLFSNLSFQFSILFAILPIFIWMLIKNRKNINLNKTQIILILISLLLVVLICIFFYKYDVIKPVEKINGTSYLMSYTYSYNIPFNKDIKFVERSCLATFISIFPMVLFVAVYYIFKYEKHFEFLIPTAIMSILGVISISGTKPFFESLVPNYIMALGISILQIYMMIYIFANVEEKLFKLKTSSYIALAGILFLLLIRFPAPLASINSKMGPVIFFILESFIFLNYSDKRFWRMASFVFPAITLFESIALLVSKII